MSGATIGGIVGGGIGFLIGGPAGARWGFMIGSTLGGIVDPVKIKGPRLGDGQSVTSQEGIPIPFGFGTFPVGGNVVWAGPLVEHEHTEGGKGGSGQEQTTYTYTRSYAIGICEGEVIVQKAWRNGKLVYDIKDYGDGPDIPEFPGLIGLAANWLAMKKGVSSKLLHNHTFYTGSETQNVDPTIEAAVGVGNSGPMRGLAYMVAEDEDLTDSAGAIPQWRFVVQDCGTVTSTLGENFVAACGGAVLKSATGETWTPRTTGLSGVTLHDLCSLGDYVAGHTAAGAFYYSTDRGDTWQASVSTFTGPGKMAAGDGRMVCLRQAGGAGSLVTTLISTDFGVTWSVGGSIATTDPNAIEFGAAAWVFASSSGLYSSPDGITWTLRESGNFVGLGYNGAGFLSGKTSFKYSANGISWTNVAGTVASDGYAIAGADGYFCVGALGTGIYRTVNNGASFSLVQSSVATFYSAAAFGSHVVIGSGGGGSNQQYWSEDSGASFALISPGISDNDIIFLGPSTALLAVPDAPGVYVDVDGNLVTDYIGTSEVSSCLAELDGIVEALCLRAGVESSEMDVTGLAGTFLTGYGCATESSAQGFIEPLTQAYFFDRGEWDKKLRFIARGGASVAALDPDDLVAMEGPAIVQTRVQEVELLRKVNILTIDPSAEFNATKQSAERRIVTIQASGESTVEMPIVMVADEAAQIADKRLKVAWAETDKFSYGLTLAHADLTATDVVTLTDKGGIAHRNRLQATAEEAGAITVDEAMKDRASTYSSDVAGVQNPNIPIENAGQLVGPTLLAVMNLPLLRSQDNSPGFYVGMCGILDGWPGAQLLMSVDGGLSYTVALSITAPTILGELTDDEDSNGEPISVRVYGTLESATTDQVDGGKNWSAVETAGVAEILAYETATPTSSNTYDLTDLTRGLDETAQAPHVSGDPFMDLQTAYFLPMNADLSGQTIYFKAVGFGVSADAVEAVAVVFTAQSIIIDGGLIS